MWLKLTKKHLQDAYAQPKFLIGGEGQTTYHSQWGNQNFSKREIFMGQRYRKMEQQKLGPGLECNLDFDKRKRLEPKV